MTIEEKRLQVEMERLAWLQRRDEDKKEEARLSSQSSIDLARTQRLQMYLSLSGIPMERMTPGQRKVYKMLDREFGNDDE